MCTKFCTNLRKGVMKTLANIRQALGEENITHARKVQTHWDWKKMRQVKSKVKNMLIIFFDIKGIVHIEFALADQTVNSTYYCDVLWRMRGNVQRICPELRQQNNSKPSLHHISLWFVLILFFKLTTRPLHQSFLFRFSNQNFAYISCLPISSSKLDHLNKSSWFLLLLLHWNLITIFIVT
jgi:hypothetical protein